MRKNNFLLVASIAGLTIAGASLLIFHRKVQYCWLVFGPRERIRVFLAYEGEAANLACFVGTNRVQKHRLPVYSELNPRMPDAPSARLEIPDPDGPTRYLIAVIGEIPSAATRPGRTTLSISVDVKGPVEYNEYGCIELADRPEKAKTAHFHGPLAAGPRTIYWNLPPDLALVAGGKPSQLYAMIGTMKAEKGCWVVVSAQKGVHDAFPKGVFPVADVEFSPKVLGRPSMKRRYALDKPC